MTHENKPQDQPAFPFTIRDDGTPTETCMGMTLRDYFAAKVDAKDLSENLAELLTGTKRPNGDLIDNLKWWFEAEAKYQYMKADAMLKERMKDVE